MKETDMTDLVSPDTITEFQSDGVTVLRGIFADWVETLRRGVDFNVTNPGPDGRFYTGDNGAGRFMTDYCNWRRIPEYRDFICNSQVAAIAQALMGSRSVQLFHEHVLIKEADADVPTPWHHDLPYYSISAPLSVSLWLPLDSVPRERTLEFVPGSHRMGKTYQPQRFNGNPINEGDGLETIPDIEANRADFDIRGWALEPGDAVAFDFRTLHGAPANRSKSDQRRAFSVRLVGEGAQFRRKPGIVTSPPFPDVTLADGAALAGEEFPVLLAAQ
jgi:ectoine hydroxylase-related dioxygenase (phytanoyl-CoA dioxygenase family)